MNIVSNFDYEISTYLIYVLDRYIAVIQGELLDFHIHD